MLYTGFTTPGQEPFGRKQCFSYRQKSSLLTCLIRRSVFGEPVLASFHKPALRTGEGFSVWLSVLLAGPVVLSAEMSCPRFSSRETLNGKCGGLKHRQAHLRLIHQKQPGHRLTFRYVVGPETMDRF